MPATCDKYELPNGDPVTACQSKHGCRAMADFGVKVTDAGMHLYKRLCAHHAREVEEQVKAGTLRLEPKLAEPESQDELAGAVPATAPKRPPRTFPIPEGATPVLCRSCGDSVFWILTPNMKRMPIDAFGAHKGESHFATCPQADQHRKPR
jgi:hypothetical protein